MKTNIAVALSLVIGMSANAAVKNTKDGGTFSVTPSSLRSQLLSSEVPVIHSLLQVYTANEQLIQAQANLLPTFGAGNASNGLFSLGWVSATLPFLMPSNWATMNSEESSLEASGYAFHIAELNEYMVVLNLYLDTRADNAVIQAYMNELQVVHTAMNRVADKNSDADANLKQKEEDIRSGMIKVQMNFVSEVATLRKMLGLPEGTKFVFPDYQTAAFDFEDDMSAANKSKLAEVAYSRAPEKAQTEALMKSNQQSGISQAFGFFGGVTAAPAVANNGISLTNVPLNTAGNFSFSVFPQMRANKENQANLQMNLVDLKREYQRIVETDLETLELTKQKLELADEATQLQTLKLSAAKAGLEVGAAPDALAKTVQSVSDYTDKVVNKIRTQTSLDHYRVDLSRRLITREFATIPKCVLQGQSRNGLLSIFDSSATVTGIDQLCRNGKKLNVKN